MPKFLRLIITLACAAAAQPALAKIAPPSEEAQAKAAEAAAKAAWSGKVAAYKLCQVQDRIASGYRAKRLMNAKELNEPVDTAACTDPGPFAAAAPGAASAEKAGAHSAPSPAVPVSPGSAPASAASVSPVSAPASAGKS